MSWPGSYPSRPPKALRKTTGKTKGTDADFFLIMPNLPKETQDYVPKLIATARVGNNHANPPGLPLVRPPPVSGE